MVYYIGSEKDLPLVAPQNWEEVDTKDDGWEPEVVPFSVEPLDDTNRAVVDKFDLPEVRYAGSFEGCGCGFNVCVIDMDAEASDGHGLSGRVSRKHLHDYIIENEVTANSNC